MPLWVLSFFSLYLSTPTSFIMDTVLALNDVDSQALTLPKRQQALELCRMFTRRVEMWETLADALIIREPTFKKFSWQSIYRLEIMLDLLEHSDDERISVLHDYDPLVVIICGLCMTKKRIQRMSFELWNDLLREAAEISKQLGPLLLHNQQISETVRASGAKHYQESKLTIALY
jgi:hypothetical protein